MFELLSRASGSANGRHRAGFRGLILTGWSRYDHFAVLCELLPTSIPSLIMDLISVSHPHSERDKEQAWRQVMGCPNGTDFRRMTALLSRDDTGRFHEATSECSFPGRDVLVVVMDLARIKAGLGRMDSIGGWTSDYNVRHNFTSTWRMREAASAERRAADNLANLAVRAKTVFAQIYDKYTVCYNTVILL